MAEKISALAYGTNFIVYHVGFLKHKPFNYSGAVRFCPAAFIKQMKFIFGHEGKKKSSLAIY